MRGGAYEPSAEAIVAAATLSPIPSLLSAPRERSYSLFAHPQHTVLLPRWETRRTRP